MRAARHTFARKFLLWSAIGLIAAAGAFAAHRAIAARAARARGTLNATEMAPRARGKARFVLKTSKRGKFLVAARHLDGAKSYSLIVGGVKVGTLQTKANGRARIVFSAKPKRHSELLGFDPRGEQVIVRDEEDNDDVLVGEIPPDDPNRVACCIGGGDADEGEDEHEDEIASGGGASEDEGENENEGDDDGECQDLLPADCVASGGVVQSVSSCLPDPCDETPDPETDIICCVNETHDDESESECEDVSSEAECAAEGGTVVAATSCDPNPCQPPPPTDRVTCCVPDDDHEEGESEGMECERMSSAACAAAGGTVNTSPSCEGDPCGA